MKWVEIIRVEAASDRGLPLENELTALVHDIRESSECPDLLNAELYKHIVVPGYLALHLAWGTEEPPNEGSILGSRLAHALKIFGVVHHSIWIEQPVRITPTAFERRTNLEYPIPQHGSNWAFSIITLMHDNPLLPFLINPLAIERVRKKMTRRGILNIRPLLANASDTGLVDQSIDVAFMFGLPYVVGGREKLMAELRRLLKPGGIIAIKKSRVSETAPGRDQTGRWR